MADQPLLPTRYEQWRAAERHVASFICLALVLTVFGFDFLYLAYTEQQPIWVALGITAMVIATVATGEALSWNCEAAKLLE